MALCSLLISITLSFDPSMLCVQFATEAAITILRIDDMIRLEKAEDEEEG